jgi:polyhydroxyalkanoate synthesis regulator phasin
LRYGFIAQDTEAALPKSLQDMVETAAPEHGLALVVRGRDKDRIYNMAYDELLSPIVKSIQQQQQEIADDNAAMRQEISALTAEIADLKKQLATLQSQHIH